MRQTANRSTLRSGYHKNVTLVARGNKCVLSVNNYTKLYTYYIILPIVANSQVKYPAVVAKHTYRFAACGNEVKYDYRQDR